MAPLVRQGLRAFFAVSLLGIATAVAGSRSGEMPEDSSESNSATAQSVRAGLRGALASLQNQANAVAAGANLPSISLSTEASGSRSISDNASGNGFSSSSSAISSMLSEPATVELAAVALSSINSFWLSLSPSARSELLNEMSNAVEENEAATRRQAETPTSAVSSASRRSSGSRRARQLREDVALYRVLQTFNRNSSSNNGHLISSGSNNGLFSFSTSTSTSKPDAASNGLLSSWASTTTIAVSLDWLKEDESEPSSRDDMDSGERESAEVDEEEVIVSPEDREKEDSALDRIQKQLAALKLEEEDIILAFRAFVRRYYHYLDKNYNERLMEYVHSEEFKEQVAKLREAMRKYAAEHPSSAAPKDEIEAGEKGERATTSTAAPGAHSAGEDASTTKAAGAEKEETTKAEEAEKEETAKAEEAEGAEAKEEEPAATKAAEEEEEEGTTTKAAEEEERDSNTTKAAEEEEEGTTTKAAEHEEEEGTTKAAEHKEGDSTTTKAAGAEEGKAGEGESSTKAEGGNGAAGGEGGEGRKERRTTSAASASESTTTKAD